MPTDNDICRLLRPPAFSTGLWTQPPHPTHPAAPPRHDTSLGKDGDRIEPEHEHSAHAQAGQAVPPPVGGVPPSREQHLGDDTTNAEGDAIKDGPPHVKRRLRE